MATPIIAVVGKKNSGKTTFVAGLVKELTQRGYKVATIKHVAPEVTRDDEGKDSWKHTQAGSKAVALTSDEGIKLMQPFIKSNVLDDAVRWLGDSYDIIIAESFKRSDVPKIEVHRKAAGEPLEDLKRLFAIITDEELDTKVRQYKADEYDKVADLLEKGYIQPASNRLSLYVDGKPVQVNSFPAELLAATLKGMVGSLKGCEDAKEIKIYYKKANQ